MARRLGQEGTVQVRIALDATGAVRAVTVLRSSGSGSLDASAVAWVQAHWRYHPATEGGRAVGSSVLANVVFDLKRAR
jgi:protein TonB